MRWPQWMHDALRLGPHEVAQVRPGLPEAELAAMREATHQPDEAVDLLVYRLTTVRPRRRARWVLPLALTGVAVAAAVLFMLRAPSEVEYGAIGVEQHAPLALSQAQAISLGPSIVMTGLATVSVEQADPTGTVVRIERGSAHFEVDPNGPFRALTVLADDTRVRVTGTAFVVHRLWDSVHVDVLRGSVLIDRDGAVTSVAAGDSWSHQGTTAPPAPIGVVAAGGPAMPAPTRDVQPPPTVRVVPTPVPETVAPAPEPPQTPEEAYSHILDAVDAGEAGAALARTLDAFLLRWPDSPMLAEAQALRLEVAAELEDASVVLHAVEGWLLAWPDHPRRLAMLELAATLARDRMRDCARALPMYRSLAIEAPRGRAARAEGHRGLCALELGDRSEARLALARALELDVAAPLNTDVQEALDLLGPAGP